MESNEGDFDVPDAYAEHIKECANFVQDLSDKGWEFMPLFWEWSSERLQDEFGKLQVEARTWCVGCSRYNKEANR